MKKMLSYQAAVIILGVCLIVIIDLMIVSLQFSNTLNAIFGFIVGLIVSLMMWKSLIKINQWYLDKDY